MDSNDRAAFQLVRFYSFHAEDRLATDPPSQMLGRILNEGEIDLASITAPWRRFFQPWEPEDGQRDPISAILSIEAEKLRKKWTIFQKSNPKEDQVDLQESEPTIQSLMNMVVETSKDWQGKKKKGRMGKTMGYFHRFCRTLNSHNNILDIVPRGNEYCSIFAGSLTAIVKASVNHESIIEELSEALCIISEHVAECETQLRLFKTKELQLAVVDLYAHVFLFLNDTMNWYLKRRAQRLLDAFNEKFLDKFEKSINNIKDKSEVIQRMASHSVAAEQRVTRLITEQTQQDLRLGLEGISRERAETKLHQEQIARTLSKLQKQWGESQQQQKFLQDCVRQLLLSAVQNQPIIGSQVLSLSSSLSLEAGEKEVDDGVNDAVTRSRHLEDYFHRDRVRLPCEGFLPSAVHPLTLARITDWVESSNNNLLYLSGKEPKATDLEDPTTLFAAKFVDFAASSGAPLISYFCELRREPARKSNTSEVQSTIALAYALIRQLVELLPPKSEFKYSQLTKRFDHLDGTLKSWEDAMAIFSGLLDALPGKVHCIVDGFQWLDDRSTTVPLEEFLGLLRSPKLKVLLTSSGKSRFLLGELSKEELLLTEELGSDKDGCAVDYRALLQD